MIWPPGKWELELGRSLSLDEWGKIYALSRKSSMSGYTQENNYKVLSRWYKTPELVHDIYPTVSDICWRCGGAIGSYMHIWWDCPDIQAFWRRIFSLHGLVTSNLVPCTPEMELLSLVPGPICLTEKSLLRHFLAASWQTIAAHWKQTGSPPLAAFFENLHYVMRRRSRRQFQMIELRRFFRPGSHGYFRFQNWVSSNITWFVFFPSQYISIPSPPCPGVPFLVWVSSVCSNL